eukprot:3412429-Ditylum_brightwellii.AAC.1
MELQNIIKKGSIQTAMMGGSEKNQLSIIGNKIFSNKNLIKLKLKSSQVGERLVKTTSLANGLSVASERTRRHKHNGNKTDSRSYCNNLSPSFLSSEGRRKRNSTPN